MPSARVRFAFEAGFLVLVAAGAALAELRPLAIIILMAGAWLLVALIERASAREGPKTAAEVEMPPRMDEPVLDEAPKAYRWLSWRRGRAPVEELVSPTAALEERPPRSHVRRIEPKPRSEAMTVVVEPEVPPEPAPGPAVTTRPLDLPGLEESPVPSPAQPARPRFAALRPRQQAAPVEPPPPPVPPAREWNIWDLERLARERAGDGPRDEEWSALFTHLRAFANAAGVLPKEFDGLVRESFGELIEVAA
jgi:hypothetical protein